MRIGEGTPFQLKTVIMKIKLALVQMHCPKGEIKTNLATIQDYIQEAVLNGVDFLCFPEMSITGYVNTNNYPDALLSLESRQVAEFVKMTNGNDVTTIAGIAEKNASGQPFITQLAAYKGELFGYYRKTNIAEDEKGLYSAGSKISTFKHPKLNFGISICADIDKREIFEEYAQQGAEIVFEVAAPGLYGSQERRNWQSGFNWWKNECWTKLGTYARTYKIFIAVSTQAGRTVDEDFPGGGYVFDRNGEIIYSTPDWDEGVLYASIEI